jgi:hypothetical protein
VAATAVACAAAIAGARRAYGSLTDT